MRVGDSVADVFRAIGKPLNVEAYSDDLREYPFNNEAWFQPVSLSDMDKWDYEPHYKLLLKYSWQVDAHTDYWRCEVWIKEGRVLRTLREFYRE